MSIDESISQDPLDHFTKSVNREAIDWQTYFHDLKPDQKADADQLLYEFKITTPNQSNTYSVIVSRTGIHSEFSLPTIDGIKANYNKELEAKSLASYLNSVRSHKGKQVVSARIEKTK